MRRSVVLALIALSTAQGSQACDCFPILLRAETAQETLQHARFVVHARVISVTSDGRATQQVIESFKGPAAKAILNVIADTGQCGPARFTTGEDAFVTAYRDRLSACDKYPPEPLLLEAFRRAKASEDPPHK